MEAFVEVDGLLGLVEVVKPLLEELLAAIVLGQLVEDLLAVIFLFDLDDLVQIGVEIVVDDIFPCVLLVEEVIGIDAWDDRRWLWLSWLRYLHRSSHQKAGSFLLFLYIRVPI